MNNIFNFLDMHGTLVVCILYGLIVLLGLLCIAISDIYDNKRKRAIKSWDEKDKDIPTIKDIQKKLVKMGSDVCIDGKLSSDMEKVWNELFIKQHEADGAVRNWLIGK